MTDPNDGDYRPDDELDRQAWEDQQWEPRDVESYYDHPGWDEEPPEEPEPGEGPIVEEPQLPISWTTR